jgi:tetratricopeptide (TPR) repeat protein
MPDYIAALEPSDADAAARSLEQAERCYEQDDYAAAHAHYQQALAWLALHSPDSREAAAAQRGLGATLVVLGEYAAGQALLEQALATRERILGPQHPDTAQVLSNLSAARFWQNDPAGALPLTEQALAFREQTLGDDHPDTLESLNDLGVIVNRLGDRTRAIAIHTEVLARCERVLGDHRRTVETLNALALRLAGDKATYVQGRALYERALLMSERVLGPSHPMTARLMNNLAAVMADLDELAEARALLERSLVLHEQIYDPDHPNIAWVVINLGDIDQHTGNYIAARAHFTRALMIREAKLGARHPDTIRALRKLIAALNKLGQQGVQAARLAAIPLHVCLTAFEAAAGTLPPDRRNTSGAYLDPERAAEHLHDLIEKLDAEQRRPPITAKELAALQHADELEELAQERLDAGEYAAAQELLEQAIGIREQAFGPAQMELVPPLESLEKVLHKLGRSSAVLPIRQRIADIHVQALGESHPHTWLAQGELANLLDSEYGLGTADTLRQRFLQAMEMFYGPDDVYVRMSRDSLARLLARRTQDAEPSDTPRQSRSEKREAILARRIPLADALLAGIDGVGWRGLRHAYGPAEDVPDLLRLLLSDEADMRGDALRALYSNIWHQGTVYQASAYVVPFLLRMLADQRTPGRLSVLHLLSSLATGNSYLAVHHREDGTRTNWRKLLAEKGEDFDTALQAELGWVQAANNAVAEGIDLLFALLDDADAGIRQQALATIALLPGRADVSVPRLPTTDDPPLRTGIVRALHDLMDDSRASQRLFAELLRNDEPEAIRLIAAVALLTRAHDRAPEEAIHVVLGALRELGAFRHPFDAPAEDKAARQELIDRFYPAWGRGPLDFSLHALSALEGELARAALLQAIRLLHDADDADKAAHTLLDLGFNLNQRTAASMAYSCDKQTGRRKIDYFGASIPSLHQAEELTAAQREILATLVDHEPLWEHQSNLLKLYGLPVERDAVRDLLTWPLVS